MRQLLRDNIWMLLAFLAAINILAFLLMLIDKVAARHKQRRIPEKWLWIVALCGSAFGSLLGMLVARHKTRHISFLAGMPLLLILQVLLLGWLLWGSMGAV